MSEIMVKIQEEVKSLGEKVSKDLITKAEFEERLKKVEEDYRKSIPNRILEYQLPEADGGIRKELRKMSSEDIMNISPEYTRKSCGYGVTEIKAENPLFTHEVKGLQELNDEAVIVASMLEHGRELSPTELNNKIKTMKVYSNLVKKMSLIGKALDTAEVAGGKEFIFTGLSQALIDRARIDANVASLFDQFELPQNPYDYPIRPATRIRLKKGSENTADDPSAKILAVTPPTGKISFSAKAIKARVVWSTELEEDSLIPVAPFIREEILESLTYDLESGILNSDVATVHFDYDTEQVASHSDKVGWNGLRSHCVDNSLTQALTTFNISNLRLLREKMSGVYSAKGSNLAYLVSTLGFLRMLALPEREREVSITDKNLTLPGQVLSVDGVPVVVSEVVRDNVTANGYNENGGTNTKSTILLVNRKAWKFGTHRKPTIKSKDDIDYDQKVVVVSWRGDFVPVWGSTGKHTYLGVDVS